MLSAKNIESSIVKRDLEGNQMSFKTIISKTISHMLRCILHQLFKLTFHFTYYTFKNILSQTFKILVYFFVFILVFCLHVSIILFAGLVPLESKRYSIP